MSILQPDMKRIKLEVPDAPEFADIRDLDGTWTEVADPKSGYRFKRGNVTFRFSSTGHTVDENGVKAEVFTATSVR
ncbi:hypothetical protein LG943_17160 [Streptomonospora sp. S1-112]|uniref:Uncharacterized protein n=1 Tax=Streptomonospora mangrovi TaxID=2883123 RepID=A0A9X3NSI8_9ACTN|nr:hypothetical protein [Streptomonospora mangrovi]MDA0566030.1 hypothetical protein [Streptomonospora mangrovi]